MLAHNACSPDLSLVDYHLFKHLKLSMRDKTSSNQTLLENEVRQFLESNPVNFHVSGMSSLLLVDNVACMRMVLILNKKDDYELSYGK